MFFSVLFLLNDSVTWMPANMNPNWDKSEEQRWNLRIALSSSDGIKCYLVSAHTIHTESIVVRETASSVNAQMNCETVGQRLWQFGQAMHWVSVCVQVSQWWFLWALCFKWFLRPNMNWHQRWNTSSLKNKQTNKTRCICFFFI